jgi:hypothetical protein
MSRQQDTPHYYRPYDSEDDTDVDTDSGYDTDKTNDSEDFRIRREEDPRYAIIRAAGPNFNTSAEQLKYMEGAPGASYTPDTNITTLANTKYLDPPKTTQTTLFCVKSANRDKSVYPSPFNYQIKLPRVYKNVTKFQLVQLSFPYNTQELASQASLTSTFYKFIDSFGFGPSCISSCLNVFTNSGTQMNSLALIEQERLTPDGLPMTTKLELPDGKHSNEQMAALLNIEANNTPPFNIISYHEFKQIFKITRDVKILFNEPGDYYHSKLLSNKYKHHTKETIMNTYYSQHDIDKHPIITDVIALNAYYFPILKELVYTEFGSYFIDITNSGINKDQLKHYVLNSFLGLDSKIYYEICLNNAHILDEYRKNLTFQHRNINKYVWSYDNKLKKFSCVHDTLHTSLKSDINNSLNKFMCDELEINSLDAMSFNSIKSENAINNTILDHLQSNLSSVAASYFLNETNYVYDGRDCYSTMSSNVCVIRSFSELHDDTFFTNMFNYSSTFGRQYGTYGGKTFSFTNFLDYHSTISSYYNIVQSTSNAISTIHGNVYGRHHQYISNKYTGVLPYSMIENKSYVTTQSLPVAFVSNMLHVPGMAYTPPGTMSYAYTAPTDYSTCVQQCVDVVTQALTRYYSCLPVNTIIAGLNYKLGLHSSDTLDFNNLTSFFEVVSTSNYDYFLRINTEQSFNNMDIAMPENYKISNETTGQAKLMYAKILTAGLGADETSQTCIQNPIIFPNALGKLDKLHFQIYLDDDSLTPMWRFYPFVLQINEWTATFQIDEEVGFADKNAGWGPKPTVPIPNNPAAMPYFGLTEDKNPDNK